MVSQLAPAGKVTEFYGFLSVAEVTQGFVFADLLTNHGGLLGGQFGHAGFDGGQVGFTDNGFARIDVVIKAVFDGWTDTELDAWVQLLQGFGHEVG
ncbi:MAG: hypothetical protein BWY72_02076 [Bacteroidetes bacterium ADurb.Bin416]|nr:MAG: hypothetical protein BWY72_02076 [Bacteroidetes bacterium ADurb.Bin416]